MIEKMKKMSLFIYHASKNAFLDKLQLLGISHINIDKTTSNENIVEANDKLRHLLKTKKKMQITIKENKLKLEQKKYQSDIFSLIEEFDNNLQELNTLHLQLDHIKQKSELLEPWGEFDYSIIIKLAEIGIKVHFHSMSGSKFAKLDKSDLAYAVIANKKGRTYFVVVADTNVPEQDETLESTEIKIPHEKLSTLYKTKSKLKTQIKEQNNKIFDNCKYLSEIEKRIVLFEDDLQYLMADASLQEEVDGKIYFVTGWFPKKLESEIIKFMEKEDVVYSIEEPSEEDNIPVKLKNGKFSKLFEPITKMHSLPSYYELDPTPFFAPFFALFFGLCMADVGYGAVMLIGVLIALFIKRKDKQLRPILYLGAVLGFFTILGGILMDTFFGMGNISLLVSKGIIPQWVSKVLILGKMNDAMSFAVLLGILQVALGFFMQTRNRMKLHGILGGLQPLGTAFILLGAIILIVYGYLGKDFSISIFKFGLIIYAIPFVQYISLTLVGLGLLMVLLFNNMQQKFYLRPLLGLWEIYGISTGLLGDILSYIRIFALGLAGGLLGKAFNDIAMMARGDHATIISIIGMLLIMIVGHLLNMALAALSAFVHPLRLILLEFYKSVDFTGGGHPFIPFKNRISLKSNKIIEE